MRKLKKVAFSHFFDTLQAPKGALSKVDAHRPFCLRGADRR